MSKKAPAEKQNVKGRLVREGVVTSDKMTKTVIVQVTRIMQHPQFKKIIHGKVQYAVHDEKKQAKMGDKVRIIQTRPISKNKTWKLVKVLSK